MKTHAFHKVRFDKYIANILQTVRDSKMLEFFMHDFNEEKWKKAALKNAFVLMAKQRFQHAAAFFLLAGSLKDAIQVFSFFWVSYMFISELVI